MMKQQTLTTILDLADQHGATIPKPLRKQLTDWGDTTDKLNNYKPNTTSPAQQIILAITEGRDPATCPEVRTAITSAEIARITGHHGFEKYNEVQLTELVRDNFDSLITAFKPVINDHAQTIVTAHAALNGIHPDKISAASVDAATAATAHKTALSLRVLEQIYSALKLIEYQTDNQIHDVNAPKLRFYDANNNSANSLRNLDTSTPWAAVTAECTPSLATNTEIAQRAEHSRQIDIELQRQAQAETDRHQPNYTIL